MALALFPRIKSLIFHRRVEDFLAERIRPLISPVITMFCDIGNDFVPEEDAAEFNQFIDDAVTFIYKLDDDFFSDPSGDYRLCSMLRVLIWMAQRNK